MNENCACEEEFIGDHSLKRKLGFRESVCDMPRTHRGGVEPDPGGLDSISKD